MVHHRGDGASWNCLFRGADGPRPGDGQGWRQQVGPTLMISWDKYSVKFLRRKELRSKSPALIFAMTLSIVQVETIIRRNRFYLKRFSSSWPFGHNSRKVYGRVTGNTRVPRSIFAVRRKGPRIIRSRPESTRHLGKPLLSSHALWSDAEKRVAASRPAGALVDDRSPDFVGTRGDSRTGDSSRSTPFVDRRHGGSNERTARIATPSRLGPRRT